MSSSVPHETILAFAKTICAEAGRYGFGQIDIVRLINALMDVSADNLFQKDEKTDDNDRGAEAMDVEVFPLCSSRLRIRRADPVADKDLLQRWMADQYGRHFLLSSATAQPMDLEKLLTNESNKVGIILDRSDEPIGSTAYLDIDKIQKRAELRKLIGVPAARGRGFAEEATRLWIQYGGEILGLEKIYVSTLQTHLRNIQLNELIGFRVEGLLQREALIAGKRYDVLRMGLCFDEFEAARKLK